MITVTDKDRDFDQYLISIDDLGTYDYYFGDASVCCGCNNQDYCFDCYKGDKYSLEAYCD